MNLKTIGDKIKGYLPAAAQIATVAATLAKVVPGIGNIVSAIELGVKIANGVANEIPSAIKVWNDIQDAAAGGRAISDEEWAQWELDINEAHSGFVAAADRVINQP